MFGGPGERVLIYDPKGSQSCVRPLQPEEVWRAHGGQSAAWSRLRRGGYEERTLVGWALRAVPAELARLLAHFCLSFYEDDGGKRSGVCSLAMRRPHGVD